MVDTSVVTIDRQLCIGSGNCLVYAPDYFTQDDEAKAVLLAGAPRATSAAVRTAVEACPTGALALRGDDGQGV